MAKLNIPDRYRAGVAAIRKLDEQSVQEIRAALDGTSRQKAEDVQIAQGTPGDVAISAVTSISATRRSDFRLIGEALAALYGVRTARDVSVEEFAEDVCDAMEGLGSEELKLPHVERDAFKAKLLTLLNADLFNLVTKVYDLATEDERTFCHARILTDLRPVFGPKLEDGPRALVVMHLLKLTFHQGNKEHKDFYVTLDADDLRSLKQLVERAESKAQTLKRLLKDVRVFGVPKEQP